MADEDVDDPIIECTLLDALNYRPLAPRLTRRRLQLRKYYHSFLLQVFIKGAPLLMLIVLPFFENQHSFSSSSDYQGKEENSGDNKSYFWTSIVLEVVFLSIVTTDALLRWFMLFPSGREFKELYKCESYAVDFRLSICYIVTLLITWILLIVRIIIYAMNGHTHALTIVTFLCQFVRPVFIITQVELIREALKAIFYTFLQLFSINILLILVIFLFAMIGLIIFPLHTNYSNNATNTTMMTFDIDEGNEYFSSLSQAYWNMLVYLTAANSPDILTPAYKHHRAYFLYFGTYFFITHYFLLKVIIALYAVRFMSFLNDSMCKSYKNRLTNLSVAFALIAKKRVYVNAEIRPEDVFSTGITIQTNDVKKYAKKIKLVLDEQEFNDMLNNSSISDILFKDQLDWNDFKNLFLTMFSCKDRIQMPVFHMGVCYESCLIIQLYVAFTSLPLAIIHTITLTVLIVKDFDNSLTNSNSAMTTASLAFSFIFIPEFIARICLIIAMSNICQRRKVRNKRSCFTFKDWFLKGHHNRFSPELKHCFSIIVYIVDLLILLAIIILGFVHVPCLYGQCLSGSNLFQLLQVNNTLVLLRLLRMTTMNVLFAIVVHTLAHILILLTPFILLIYLLYYEFAILGMTTFRNINFDDIDGNAMTRCGSYENLYYYPYNFEDFSSSMVTLWNLMIVNNWHIITDAYVRGTAPAAMMYFALWWLIMETVVNGVLYGVLLKITLKVINNTLKVSNEFKNESMCKKIIIVLERYMSIQVDDSPFRYSLIDAWNIQGVINFNIKKEDMEKINNEAIEKAIKNPDLLAELRNAEPSQNDDRNEDCMY